MIHSKRTHQAPGRSSSVVGHGASPPRAPDPLALLIAGAIVIALVVVVAGYRFSASWGSGGVELAPAPTAAPPSPPGSAIIPASVYVRQQP